MQGEPYDLFPLVTKLPGYAAGWREADLNGATCSFYSLGTKQLMFAGDAMALRSAWAKACVGATGCDVHAIGSRSPLLVMKDSVTHLPFGALTSCLRTCFDASTSFKMRLSLDLDMCEGGDRMPFPDLDELHGVVCEFLQNNTTRDDANIVYVHEACFLFFGSNAVKNRTGHIIFSELSFAPVKVNLQTATGDIAKLFDAVLKPFGLQSDLGICRSGLRWEFSDKYDKGDRNCWRNTTNPLAAAYNVELPMSFADMSHAIDPHVLVGDLAWGREVFWVEPPKRAVPPQQQQQQRNNNNEVIAGVGNVVQRVKAAVPQWEDLILKKQDFHPGSDLYLPTSLWCPYKNEFHSAAQTRVVHMKNSDVITIGCFSNVCMSHPKYPFTLVLQPPDENDDLKAQILAWGNSQFVQTVASASNLNPIIFRKPTSWEQTYGYFMSPSAFKSAYTQFYTKVKKRMVYWAAEWLALREKEQAPNGFVMNPQFTPAGTINLWRGFDPAVVAESLLVPNDGSGCPLILRHIRENICDSNASDSKYLLDWCALLFQKPWLKPGVAIVLKGLPGMGKNAFAWYLRCIIGKHHYYETSDGDSVVGRFNESFAMARLMLLDEAIGTDSKRSQSILNTLITSPTIDAEEKMKPRHNIASFHAFIINSNNPFTVKQQNKERRYQNFIVDYQIGDIPKDQFFAALMQEAGAQGKAAFLAFLMARDISNFNPETEVRRNRGSWLDFLYSLDLVQRWWFHCLKRGYVLEGGYQEEGGVEQDVCGVDAWGTDVGKDVFHASCCREVPNATASAMWTTIYQGFDKSKEWIEFKPHGRKRQIALPTLARCRQVFETITGYAPPLGLGESPIWTWKESFQ